MQLYRLWNLAPCARPGNPHRDAAHVRPGVHASRCQWSYAFDGCRGPVEGVRAAVEEGDEGDSAVVVVVVRRRFAHGVQVGAVDVIDIGGCFAISVAIVRATSSGPRGCGRGERRVRCATGRLRRRNDREYP